MSDRRPYEAYTHTSSFKTLHDRILIEYELRA